VSVVDSWFLWSLFNVFGLVPPVSANNAGRLAVAI
jgi:hypothetical protein